MLLGKYSKLCIRCRVKRKRPGPVGFKILPILREKSLNSGGKARRRAERI
ncbi:hypothetical protein GCWU000341_02249 [Oribacterium sp. oral taxon 078 str. F0262]|nr:hypothetical protein GCWU000341_02249 [Oribacterium sp. oral taxon 078 str. F0262]